MLKQVFVAVLIAITVSEDAEPKVEVEEGVLVLNSKNFDHVVNNNEFVLVEFYAPWCGHCKKLTPEYAKAAKTLEEEGSNIKLAKVDATEEKDLGSKFGVRGFPTLKFFRNGEASDYSGGRTEETIVNWVKKKSGPPAVTLTEGEQVEELVKNDVAIIGFFKDVDSKEAGAFLAAAAKIDDYPFGICSDEKLMKEYEIEKEGVTLFKKFDELRADLNEDLTQEKIQAFIQAKSVPLLTEFTEQTASKLFVDKEVAFFFLAIDKSSDGFAAASDAVKKMAEANQGKIRAVLLDAASKHAGQVLSYLSITEKDTPTYRILNLEKNLKYKPEDSDLSEEKVKAFAEGYLSGDIKPYLKSQDVPEKWDAEAVKVLVGKNFKEVALDDSKHVFVEFYAPWCGHCKKLAPIWDELANMYAGSKDVVIAKMDSTLNEVEEVSIRGFPTLKFFPANSEGKIVDYTGDRSLEDLVKFVSKYSEPPKKEEEKVEPDTPEEVKEEKKETEEKKEKDEL